MALIITARPPEPFRAAIAGLPIIAGFHVTPGPVQAIRDIHLDTAARTLGHHHLALRLRRLDGRLLIALKGGDVRDDRGGVTRIEMEGNIQEMLGPIGAAVEGYGVSLPRALPAGIDPLAPLARAGLIIVQERETRREIFEVRSPDESARLAYLAIDQVWFHVEPHMRGREPGPAGRVGVDMIEVEDLDDRGASGEVAAALLRAFAGELRTWPYGKLATGEAIQVLMDRGDLGTAVDADGRLQPAAFDRLAAYLEGGEEAV